MESGPLDTSLELGTKPIFRLLLRYSIPSVIAMVVQILYNIVDAAVVGHFVGGSGLAAVTLVFPLQIFSAGFGLLIGVGACSCIAMQLGQRKREDAERVLGNAFVLIFVTSAVMITCLLVLGYWYIGRCATSPEIERMAKTFLVITTSFGFLAPTIFGLNNIIRAQGNPHVAMNTLLLSSILNVILNPIFVGCFQWGVAGSAWATVLSQIVTFVWVVLFFNSRRSLLRLRRQNFRLDWRICRPILLIGLAPFLTQSVGCLQGMILMGQLGAYGGESALTIWGVIYRTVTVVFMVVLGIHQGAQPIIGYNYGARQFHRVLKTLQTAILLASVWCVMIVTPVVIFPEQLVQIFTPMTPDLKLIAVVAVRLSTITLILLGFQVISSHYFQAVGKPKLAIFLSLTRQVFFLIPLLLILPHVMMYFGQPAVNGIWGTFIISDILSCSLTAIFYWREVRELRSGNVRISQIASQLDF